MRRGWIFLFGILVVGGLWFLLLKPEPAVEVKPVPDLQSPATQSRTEAYPELLRLGDALLALSLARKANAINAPFAEVPADPALAGKFQTFASLARQTAGEIDANDGPHDLACIFRGMAADSLHKLELLEAAKTQGEQAPIWADAVYLFTDVRGVLVPGETRTNMAQNYAGETCPIEATTD